MHLSLFGSAKTKPKTEIDSEMIQLNQGRKRFVFLLKTCPQNLVFLIMLPTADGYRNGRVRWIEI